MPKAEELIEARELLGMRYQKEMADSLGYQRPYYCDLENGKKPLTIDLVLRLVEKFGHQLGDSLIQRLAEKTAPGLGNFMANSTRGMDASTQLIPLTGVVQAGRYEAWANTEAVDWQENKSATEAVPVPTRYLDPNYEYCAVTAKGDSMQLFGILDGDILVVAKSSFVADGKIAIVETVFGDRLVKRIKDNGNQLLLESGNTNAPVMVLDKSDSKIMGIVKHVLRFEI